MIAEIEDAMVSAIQGASLGYALGTVGSYGGELSGDENAMAQVMRQFPSVWVMFSGEDQPTPLGTHRDQWLVVGTFAIMVATKSARGERFTRHNVSPGVEVGAYQIIQDVRDLLLNQDLGLQIQQIKPGPVKSLFNKKLLGQTIAVLQVAMRTKYIITAPGTNQPDWLTTQFNYYLDSTSQPSPDATDIITVSLT